MSRNSLSLTIAPPVGQSDHLRQRYRKTTLHDSFYLMNDASVLSKLLKVSQRQRNKRYRMLSNVVFAFWLLVTKKKKGKKKIIINFFGLLLSETQTGWYILLKVHGSEMELVGVTLVTSYTPCDIWSLPYSTHAYLKNCRLKGFAIPCRLALGSILANTGRRMPLVSRWARTLARARISK